MEFFSAEHFWHRTTLEVMSNLIPTPRTNKNGVTSIRHMKPEHPGTPAAHAALASIAPAAPQAPASISNKRVISMLKNSFNMPDTAIEVCLDYMRSDNEETIPLAVHLMSNGNEDARRMAHNIFYQAIRRLDNARYEEETDEFWYEKCEASWSDSLQPELAMVWAVGETIDETETSTSWATLRTSATYFNNALMVDAGHGDEKSPTSTEYWRGISALALANELEKGSMDEWREFVEHAGTHDDLKSLVNTAKERGTVNVESLRSIMEQAAHTTGSLRDGIL